MNRKVFYCLFDLVLILGVSSFFCFYNLGNYSFGWGDQTIHSKVVQEMAQGGSFWVPTRNGNPYYNKPPFKMWISALTVRLLGESDLSYRVVDGACGVIVLLSVFYFALSLFKRRSAAYFSLAALLGSELFFYGHGVRVAVQDPMLLVFITAALICFWHLIELSTVEDSRQHQRSLYLLACAIGLFTGLGILTKSVAALIIYIVVAGYLLLSGKLVVFARKAFFPATAMAVISLIVPALYLVPRFLENPVFYRTLVEYEAYSRATKGFHFVTHRWYYFRQLFVEQVAAPPFLLVCSLLWAVVRGIHFRERKILFLLCWALIPFTFYSLLKSKLPWYIMPSLPAIALLVGGLCSNTLNLLREVAYERHLFRNHRFIKELCLATFLLVSLSFLSKNLIHLATSIATTEELSPADLIVRHALEQRHHRLPDTPLLLVYKDPVLSPDEIFYWDMLGVTPVRDQVQLVQEMNKGTYNFVITSVENLPDIARVKNFYSYLFFKPMRRRMNWAVLLSYLPDDLPPQMVPVTRSLNWRENTLMAGYGFLPAEAVGRTVFRRAENGECSLLLQGDALTSLFGTEVTLRAGAKKPLSLQILLNGAESAKIEIESERPKKYTVNISGDRWKSGTNQLLLRYQYRDNNEVPVADGTFLLASLDIRLLQGNMPGN